MKAFFSKNYTVYLIVAVCIIALPSSLSADITNNVSVNPDITYQTFEGFGQGSMDQFIPYWYTVWPSAKLVDYLNKMYTLNDNGLGLEITRIPMPVGDAPGHEHMWAYGNQGYRSPESFELEDGIYNWNGHEDILWHIQGAAGRGARMWAYWHSMPYWMTVSGCTSGHTDGANNNLQSGQEARFAQHMCDVLEHFRDYWNVDFEFVGAINEADEDWWQAYGGQPGCHVSSTQAVTIHQELKDEMVARGIRHKLVAPDSFSASVDHNLDYLDTMLNSSIGPDIKAISCHQYWVNEDGMNQWYWRSVDYEKSLWMSEWGDWTNTGNAAGEQQLQAMNYANKIQQALKDLHCTAWIIWEPKFLLDVTDSGFTFRKSYWTVAQFSRFVRSQMQQINSTDSAADCKTTVWLDPTKYPDGQKLVLVTVNSGSQPATINYDFSPFHGVKINEIKRTSPTENYADISFVQTSDFDFSISVPAESTLTISAEVLQCQRMPAELTDDCIVDISDLEQIAVNWLTSEPAPCPPVQGDADGDCKVDLTDMALASADWLVVKAFNPEPAEGQTSVNPDLRLYWAPNFYADSHDVYIGTNQTDVQNATRISSLYQGNTQDSFYPVVLNPNQLYYWRVDSVDGAENIQKGDLWSFTTGPVTADPDLVGWWKLDETSGSTAYDSSTFSNNGTLKGDPVWRPSDGIDAGAIDLDGNGDAVEINGLILTTNTVTFTAWINGWKTVDWAGILYSRRPDQACGMHFGGNNTLHYTWNYDDSSTWNWSVAPVIPQDQWAFVAVAIQPEKATAYVYTPSSGLQSAVNAVSHIPQTIDNLKLGWDSIDNTRYFNGLMDDVRIYKRTLSELEILNLIQ